MERLGARGTTDRASPEVRWPWWVRDRDLRRSTSTGGESTLARATSAGRSTAFGSLTWRESITTATTPTAPISPTIAARVQRRSEPQGHPRWLGRPSRGPARPPQGWGTGRARIRASMRELERLGRGRGWQFESRGGPDGGGWLAARSRYGLLAITGSRFRLDDLRARRRSPPRGGRGPHDRGRPVGTSPEGATVAASEWSSARKQAGACERLPGSRDGGRVVHPAPSDIGSGWLSSPCPLVLVLFQLKSGRRIALLVALMIRWVESYGSRKLRKRVDFRRSTDRRPFPTRRRGGKDRSSTGPRSLTHSLCGLGPGLRPSSRSDQVPRSRPVSSRRAKRTDSRCGYSSGLPEATWLLQRETGFSVIR